jgi:hypothetical protein
MLDILVVHEKHERHEKWLRILDEMCVETQDFAALRRCEKTIDQERL